MLYIRSANIMKRIIYLALLFSLIFSLSSCTCRELADMTSGLGDGYAYITWDGRTYVPYGALNENGKRGKQIGIVDGDGENRVYELKGYSAEEWIVNCLPHDPGMLLREIGVTDIPEGWESEYEWN